jgi:hypothetical protein
MTQNIASYKLQLFCNLQVLQCLRFEVWAHLGSRVFGVFGLGYLHHKQQQFVHCATSQNVHCTSHQLHCTLFTKQTTKELHNKKGDANNFCTCFVVHTTRLISMLQVTFNFQSLTILKWKHKEQITLLPNATPSTWSKRLDQKFSKPNTSLEKMQEFSIINSFTFKVLLNLSPLEIPRTPSS